MYEYAVIRVVPRVEREEFINVGIILFSKRKKFLRAKYMLHEAKLKMLFPEIDIGVIRENLRVYDQVCSGSRDGGPIAGLDIPERFRWLTAVRSTVHKVEPKAPKVHKVYKVHKVCGPLRGVLSTAACTAESRNRESLNLKSKSP